MARLVYERADLLPVLGEIFREYGYEGTSLALITGRTGLGKGSLYNFFPGGKSQMAQAVLGDIQAWFAQEIFQPLEEGGGLEPMFDRVEAYFCQGRRVCLMGTFALTETRDRFAQQLSVYFERWEAVLVTYFTRRGETEKLARQKAVDILIGIQGGLTLSRARNDPEYFRQGLKHLRETHCG